ncbi:MAG: hypothetical protein NT062_00110 [Proteobacteria bacterium]|nr:hypothetical protein [Pseudomonadota bacterium]
MTREDVVLQRPEDLSVLVPVFHTTNACCGAATAYLLRRIAYRAGAYAPGIQEHMFHELNTSREGGSLDKVQRWFGGHVGALNELGYRLQSRRVATPTAALLDWVRTGRGYRGAMLPTNFKKLHPQPGAAGNVLEDGIQHAVGITVDRLDPAGADDLVMIDPWPGTIAGASDRDKVSPALEAAHRDQGFQALIYYWVGWS